MYITLNALRGDKPTVHLMTNNLAIAYVLKVNIQTEVLISGHNQKSLLANDVLQK